MADSNEAEEESSSSWSYIEESSSSTISSASMPPSPISPSSSQQGDSSPMLKKIHILGISDQIDQPFQKPIEPRKKSKTHYKKRKGIEFPELDAIIQKSRTARKASLMLKQKREKRPPRPVPPPPPSPTPKEDLGPQPEPEDHDQLLWYLHEFYLNPADIRRMPKREELFVFDTDTKCIVGKLSICTESDEEKVLIQIEGIRQTDPGNKKEVVFIFGGVSTKFVGLREFRSEEAWDKKNESFRSLNAVYAQELGCYVSAKHGVNGDEINENYLVKNTDMKRILSEAAVLVLMRKLSNSYFCGTLKLRCIYISGHICTMNLRVYRPKIITTNDVSIEVVRIRRKILCPNGQEEISNTFISTAGQFIAQVFKNESCRLQIDPWAVLHPYECIKPERLVPLRCRYEHDPMMYSYYLDEVDRWTYKNKLYLHDHQGVYFIMSRFLKELLARKPHRVIAFAQYYFSRLLKD